MRLANGFTGVFSLGHVGFVAVGAYALGHPVAAGSPRSMPICPTCPHWLASITLSFLPATIVAGLVCVVLAFRRRCAADASFRLLRLGRDARLPDHRQRRPDQRRRLHPRRPHLHRRAARDDARLGGRLADGDPRRPRPHRLFAGRPALPLGARGYDRGAGDRDQGAADAAFRLHARRLLRRRRRLALRPLSRLVLAGELLHGLHLRARSACSSSAACRA